MCSILPGIIQEGQGLTPGQDLDAMARRRQRKVGSEGPRDLGRLTLLARKVSVLADPTVKIGAPLDGLPLLTRLQGGADGRPRKLRYGNLGEDVLKTRKRVHHPLVGVEVGRGGDGTALGYMPGANVGACVIRLALGNLPKVVLVLVVGINDLPLEVSLLRIEAVVNAGDSVEPTVNKE